MSRRLIDADALKESVHTHDYMLKDCLNTTDKGMFTVGIMQAIDEQPTIDAEPVKRGEWRKTYLDHEAFGERPSIFYCSACCACSNVKTKYCPQCGARMDEE